MVGQVRGLAGEQGAGLVARGAAGLRGLVVLRRQQTSVASSATLRPARSTPPSSRVTVYEPAGRVAARSAIVAHRASSHANPCGCGATRRRHRSTIGCPDDRWDRRLDAQQERVAVAIERQRPKAEDVARRLALAPQRPARAEWKCTSPVASVAASASASSQPTMRTCPSATSWTTPARPSAPHVTNDGSRPPRARPARR